MAEDSGDKTELPSEHRRQEVREKGNVARSADLNSASLVLAAASALHFYGAEITLTLIDVLRQSLSAPAWETLDIPVIMAWFWQMAALMLRGVVPLMAILMLASIAINVAQVGFLISNEALELKFSRLNPLEGIKRIFSMQGVVKLVASLLKLIVLTSIAAGFISSQLPMLLHGMDLESASFCRQLGQSLVSLAFQLAIGLAVLALLDYGFQLWKFEQDLKMTKQEVRDEMRHMEGDPQIRQRRKEAHRKLVAARQIQQVKEADVIITNPTEIAVAIKYDAQKMAAPIVLAKGMGVLAERIRRMAIENGVPIIEKKPLARALYRDVKVGQAVPVEFYGAVAEILAYVFRLSGKYPKLKPTR